MYVCICNPVTDSQVRACVRSGACTLTDLQAQLGVALQCGQCATAALEIVCEMTSATPRCEPQPIRVAA
jgi:bacterioferritin-associated ferredoxin